MKHKESNPVLVEGKNIYIVKNSLTKVFESDNVEWYSKNDFYVKVPSVLPQMIQKMHDALLDCRMSLTYSTNGKYVEIRVELGEKYVRIVNAVNYLLGSIENSVSDSHFVKNDKFGIPKKYCFNTQKFFDFYCANESENQAGVDRCDKCGEVVLV